MNSYAYNNSAMFGGVADVENYDSSASFENCFFEKNYAFLFDVKAGAGTVINAKAGGKSTLFTKNCSFFNSGVSAVGKTFN